MSTRKLLSALLVCYALTASEALAAPVIGGTTEILHFPIQDVILPANTAFNPTDVDVLADDVAALGTSTFTRSPQSGTTIEFTDGSFTGSGSHPLLGQFELLSGPDNGFAPMTMRQENVVQDAGDPGFDSGDPSSIVSAEMVEFVVPEYGVNLLDLGVSLEVRDSFFFTATFDGLPPSVGTLALGDPFLGPSSELPAYLAGTNDVVAVSTERRWIAAPEPNALVLIGTATALAGLAARRRC